MHDSDGHKPRSEYTSVKQYGTKFDSMIIPIVKNMEY